MENTPQYVLECHVRYPVRALSSVMCTPVWRCHQCGMYVLIVKYGFHWNVIRMGTQDTGVTFQLVENHIGIAGVTDDYAASHVTRFWLTTFSYFVRFFITTVPLYRVSQKHVSTLKCLSEVLRIHCHSGLNLSCYIVDWTKHLHDFSYNLCLYWL